MNLYLNDAKVLKHFGTRPWLGRRIRLMGVKKSACGIRWQNGWFGKGGKWVPHEMQTDIVVALKPIKKNYWQVFVERDYRQQVEMWLLDRCQ